jgi:hypothetical protein
MKTYVWAETTPNTDDFADASQEDTNNHVDVKGFFIFQADVAVALLPGQPQEISRGLAEETAKGLGQRESDFVKAYIDKRKASEMLKFWAISLPDDASWNEWFINHRRGSIDWEAYTISYDTDPASNFDYLRNHTDLVLRYVKSAVKNNGLPKVNGRPGQADS